MAGSNGEAILWKMGVFQVYCCVNAFNAQETCKLVLCECCHIRHSMVSDAEKVVERRKRLKRNAGESVAKLTGVPTKGDCMCQTRADLRNLELITNGKYCAGRRKVSGIRKNCQNMLSMRHYAVRDEIIAKLGFGIVI